MHDRPAARWRYVALGLLLLWAIVYQIGPVWDHFTARWNSRPAPVDRTLALLLDLIMPLFCAVLGFAVAFRRAQDRRAWLLLALLLGFGEAMRWGVDFTRRTDWLRLPAVWYSDLAENLWPLAMFLFIVYFPHRLALDRRHPWLKWLWIAPSLFIAVLVPPSKLGSSLARGTFQVLGSGIVAISIATTSSFFGLLAYRYRSAKQADHRRRLRLLLWGLIASLTPTLLLNLARIARGARDMDFAPAPLVVGALLMICLFPLTFAHVMVVERALDLHVVVRQGLQYALARNGVLVLQIILTSAILIGSITAAESSGMSRPLRIALIAISITFVFLLRGLSERLRGWIDRRFFRAAWRAEQVLGALAEDVRSIVETRPLLQTVTRHIAESLHVSPVAVLLREGRIFQPAYVLGENALPAIAISEDAPLLANLSISRRPLAVSRLSLDGLAPLDPEVLVPLTSRDKLLGVLTLGPKRSEEPYSSSDLDLLATLATQTGLALENSLLVEAIANETARRERLSNELEIAREVQQRLFPQESPCVSGLDYAGACRPALGVGGDYYDFLQLPGPRLGLAVGDVSGKGVPAALLMASLQASLRGQLIHAADNLALLMAYVNRLLCDSTDINRYATFFYGQYDPRDSTLTWVNAGHNAPLLIRGVDVVRLEEGGPVVGLLRSAVYCQASLQLVPGDIVIAYTDGISEAMSTADEEWGEERLIEAVRTCAAGADSRGMITSILRCADQFTAGAPQHDDMTLVVLRVLHAGSTC